VPEVIEPMLTHLLQKDVHADHPHSRNAVEAVRSGVLVPVARETTC
jgi:hypothetical protein